MTRQEFLEQLRKALGSRVSSSVVNENISYYEEYIVTQIRAGKDEESVIAGLGDPRLLARSIADADKRSGVANTESMDDTDGQDEYSVKRSYNIPGWLILVCVVLIVIFILSAVFSVMKLLLPMIIPIAIVIFFLRILQIK